MGITCKPIGKLQSMLRKIENENVKEQHLLNQKKGKNKENKKSELIF